MQVNSAGRTGAAHQARRAAAAVPAHLLVRAVQLAAQLDDLAEVLLPHLIGPVQRALVLREQLGVRLVSGQQQHSVSAG